jgi:hypothetical protein
MRRLITLIATIAFAVSMSGSADAAACKDAKGKFTKCPAPAAASASFTLDAKGNCHDAKGKMAKKTMCAAPAGASATAMASSAPMATAGGSAGAMATGGAPNCKKGKPCGHSCIAVDKVCHK